MFKINGTETNYNNVYIYDGENILFQTCRPYELNIEVNGLTIRNARKINFDKSDVFEVKSENKNDGLFRNGKDLYIPVSVISVKSITEKKHNEIHGETNYKNIYVLEFHCEAFRWNTHYEKLNDFPPDMTIEKYDINGKWGSGYSKEHNMYDVHEDPITGKTWVSKQYLTYDVMTEITIESDYYTRTEKTDERIEREKIANIISSCMYGTNSISHYEVERIMEKLNISIKE